MTDEKIREAIERYKKTFNQFLPEQYEDFSTLYHPDKCKMFDHILWMLPQMEQFLKEGRREKLMRWLGFIQGVCWSSGIYSMNELMDHVRPDGSTFDKDA